MCISGPPCVPGKTPLSIFARQLLGAEDQRAARAAQRLVRGRGDDVAVRDRGGIEAGGDQSGDVRDVGHQQRADAIGDLAEAREVERARVGGEAGDDQLGLVLLRQPLQRVVVDRLGLRADAVGDEVVELAGEVDLASRG